MVVEHLWNQIQDFCDRHYIIETMDKKLGELPICCLNATNKGRWYSMVSHHWLSEYVTEGHYYQECQGQNKTVEQSSSEESLSPPANLLTFSGMGEINDNSISFTCIEYLTFYKALSFCVLKEFPVEDSVMTKCREDNFPFWGTFPQFEERKLLWVG